MAGGEWRRCPSCDQKIWVSATAETVICHHCRDWSHPEQTLPLRRGSTMDHDQEQDQAQDSQLEPTQDSNLATPQADQPYPSADEQRQQQEQQEQERAAAAEEHRERVGGEDQAQPAEGQQGETATDAGPDTAGQESRVEETRVEETRVEESAPAEAPASNDGDSGSQE